MNSAWGPLESWNVLLNNQKKKKKQNADDSNFINIQTDIKGLLEICLFCWNWKLFTESIVNKGKS